MTRDDDIRRQEKRRETTRRADERKRQSNLDWDKRTRERRQRDESARTTQAPLKRREATRSKPRPAIKPKTAKRAGQEREYSKLRREYLERNPICHCCIERKRSVQNPAVQVHHTAGREGGMLNEVRFWMAVCEECHRWIHGHTSWSHTKGWLLTRSTPELELAELIEKRGELGYVRRELERD